MDLTRQLLPSILLCVYRCTVLPFVRLNRLSLSLCLQPPRLRQTTRSISWPLVLAVPSSRLFFGYVLPTIVYCDSGHGVKYACSYTSASYSSCSFVRLVTDLKALNGLIPCPWSFSVSATLSHYGVPHTPSTWLYHILPQAGETFLSKTALYLHLRAMAEPVPSSLITTNHAFRDIVISLAGTYGLYFIGSLMHFEPWHMFTSFLQYMFLLPSYVNILSEWPLTIYSFKMLKLSPVMYAMCNLHDVTWYVNIASFNVHLLIFHKL